MLLTVRQCLSVAVALMLLIAGCGEPTPTPTRVYSFPTPDYSQPYLPGWDRDCGDFLTFDEAWEFFIAAGGPENDPHLLDMDRDGIPCETLRY